MCIKSRQDMHAQHLVHQKRNINLVNELIRKIKMMYGRHLT